MIHTGVVLFRFLSGIVHQDLNPTFIS